MGMRRFTFFLIPLMIALTGYSGWAQDTAKSPKPVAEKIFSGDFEAVWGKVIEVLTEKGLSEHPHGKMSADKDSGKITTPVFRYFKIFSAKPVKEVDYRDSYTITVSRTDTAPSDAPAVSARGKGKFTKVVVLRKFEIFDNEKKQWLDGNPAQENVGYTEEALLNAISAGAGEEGGKSNLNITPPLSPK